MISAGRKTISAAGKVVSAGRKVVSAVGKTISAVWEIISAGRKAVSARRKAISAGGKVIAASLTTICAVREVSSHQNGTISALGEPDSFFSVSKMFEALCRQIPNSRMLFDSHSTFGCDFADAVDANAVDFSGQPRNILWSNSE